jgi:AsmA protein
MTRRSWTWLAALLISPFALLALAALWLALFGWNWARGPLQEQALQRTGRVLNIAGDLSVEWAWPLPGIRAQGVQFANPPWAREPQMVQADTVDVRIDLPALLRGQLAFHSVQLTRPRVFLEQASGGRKTWLLDKAQTDEATRIPIGRLLLDQGEATYTDTSRDTRVHARLSTQGSEGVAGKLVFSADGRLQGQPLQASGSGGAMLAWRDESTPYPLQVKATLGATRVQAEGTVTSLFKLTGIDLKLALSGNSLAALFPLIGVALPPTPAYSSAGRFVRSGTQWRYENFTGRIGHSDIAGRLQLDTAGPRNKLTGALTSRQLSLADLGPAVGSRNAAPEGGTPAAPAAARKLTRMLPDLPFDTARWASLDADVTLRAETLLRDKALPLDQLQFHLVLQDGVVTLDPLAFGLAGGKLQGVITLDSRKTPLQGQARMQLRGLLLGRLLPTVDLSKNSIGQLNGAIELTGQGASVGEMLAKADGRLSLVAQNGRISRLLMEQSGLHLIEIFQLTLAGDQTVGLRCAVADFGVKGGVMQARALVLDTDVNTLTGSGRVNLGDETLDLTIVPRTKVSSVVALRSPVFVKGTFSQPKVALDAGGILTRGAGALALGLLNPLLALIPLFEAGPGVDSPCQQLVNGAKAPLPPDVKQRRAPAAAR